MNWSDEMKVLGGDYTVQAHRGDSKGGYSDWSDSAWKDTYYDYGWWDTGGYDEAYPGWSDDS